jgi:hypothetical protein
MVRCREGDVHKGADRRRIGVAVMRRRDERNRTLPVTPSSVDPLSQGFHQNEPLKGGRIE